MNKVIYASKGGNTKKLAEAVAKGAGVQAVAVGDAGTLEGVDILFVGASLYAGKIDTKLRAFLQPLRAGQAKRVVVFGSAAGKNTALPEIKELLGASGIAVSDEQYHCKGSFLLAHRGHPDAADLAAAEAFAKAIVG